MAKRPGDDFGGYKLLEQAVRNGGKKLDSYDGNFEFYTKNGFEPVSWVKFDKEYKPDGWKEGIDKEEPVVFFKYVGKGKVQYMDLEKFYKEVSPAESYDKAQEQRDAEV